MYDQDGNQLVRRAADPNNEPVKFITGLDTHGFLNGVVNLTLVTARFSAGEAAAPSPTGAVVVAEDTIVASRLRMDLFAAQTLYDVLGAIIAKNSKPANEKAN